MVEYTRRRVVCVANEAGSSRSCVARDGSDLWMSPSVAMLTGVESPQCATSDARGWDEINVLLLGLYTNLWTGSILIISRCTSSGLSCNCSSRVMRCRLSVGSFLGGHDAVREACACAASSSSNSVCRSLVLLRVPTAGFAICGACHLPRPWLLPGFWDGEGVSGTICGSTAGARTGDFGGDTASVVGIYRMAMRFMTCEVGGTDEERGRGGISAGQECALSIGGSGYGDECMGSSTMRRISGGVSVV